MRFLFIKGDLVMKKIYLKKGIALLTAAMMLAGCSAEEKPKETVDTNITSEEVSPVYAKDLEDGKYYIDVSSSSSMFRAVSTVLTVEDGKMTAEMTLSAQGYLRLFLGTKEDAQKAAEEDFYYFNEGEDGSYSYTFPVEALNKEFDCAAYSIRREKWYDRVLVFEADTLREMIPDGEYDVDVTLLGGTGKSTITNPAKLKIEKGNMTATIEWSSPFYDYMVIDFIKYYPVNEDGNSVFEIPVKALDKEIEVSADTTAMSTPHEIDYTLIFHLGE